MYGQSSPPNESFVKLASGFDHTCGLKGDGTVLCWGDNSYGQINPPSEQFVYISSGYRYSCGVTQTGSIECWGAGTINDGCSSPDWNCGQGLPPEDFQLWNGAQ